jgi:hypothetical protein
MTCAKAHVTATYHHPSGATFTGTNAVRNPQTHCPRVGRDYRRDCYALCAIVCDQPHHAEIGSIRAAEAAGLVAEGGEVVVDHWRVCAGCAGFLGARGIKWRVAGLVKEGAA